MVDVLLISDAPKNIHVVWQHFCTKDYAASAATGNEAAMKTLVGANKGVIPVFYCSNETNTFIEFYRMLRSDERTADLPLIVLADTRWMKVLTEYIHLSNAYITGVTVGEEKLAEIMRTVLKDFDRPAAPSKPAAPRRTYSRKSSNSNNNNNS